MARVTEQEVKDIINTTLTDEQVTPFIDAANAVIDGNLGSQGYGVTELKEICRWLAAHFVAIRDPRVSKEKLGDADATYHGKSGMGLDHTPYGQQVKILEHNGILAKLQAAKTTAEIKAVR